MVNDFGETSAADILAGINNEIQQNKAGKTSNSKFTPNFYLPASDEIEVSDDLDLNGNLLEFDDTLQISDDIQLTQYDSGLFQITDDAGAGTGVTQPGKIEFADVG